MSTRALWRCASEYHLALTLFDVLNIDVAAARALAKAAKEEQIRFKTRVFIEAERLTITTLNTREWQITYEDPPRIYLLEELSSHD